MANHAGKTVVTKKTHHESHRSTYIKVFVALAVLTLVEVFVPSINTSKMVIATALTLLALAKAFMVAYYFMHLNEESRWMKFLIFMPVYAIVFTIVAVAESLYR